MSLDDRTVYTERCTRCSQCKFVPLARSDAFASICPSMDYGQFHAFSGGGKVITSYAYNAGACEATDAMIDSVYACTMCGACDTACKTHMGDQVEPFDTLLELRARLAGEGHVPQTLQHLVEQLDSPTAPRQPSESDSWHHGLGIKDAGKDKVDVLFHVGRENAADRAQWGGLRLIARLLTQAGVDFGIAYDDEADSGALAYELGYRDIAERLADTCFDQIARSGASILLVGGASDYAGFRNIYPRMARSLAAVRVVHTTEYIEELIGAGRLALEMMGKGKAAYHDSCRLGRRSEPYVPWQGQQIRVLNTLLVSDPPRHMHFGVDGNYNAPRSLLARIAGLDVQDFERSREFSYCCGGGCGVSEAYPEMADQAALQCLDEAASQGAEMIVSGSAGCQRNMQAAAERHGRATRVVTVFELLAQCLVGEAG